jgi:hypothetical protein
MGKILIPQANPILKWGYGRSALMRPSGKAHGRLHIEICGLPCNTVDGPHIKQEGVIIFY